MAAQYIVGIWEFQVNDLDKELIQDMEEYIRSFTKRRGRSLNCAPSRLAAV